MPRRKKTVSEKLQKTLMELEAELAPGGGEHSRRMVERMQEAAFELSGMKPAEEDPLERVEGNWPDQSQAREIMRAESGRDEKRRRDLLK